MFGRWDLPQLDAKHAPSARAHQPAEGGCFARCRGPQAPPQVFRNSLRWPSKSGTTAKSRETAHAGALPSASHAATQTPIPAVWEEFNPYPALSNILTQSFGLSENNLHVREENPP